MKKPIVVNWSEDGREIRNFVDPTGKLLSRPQNTELFFKPGLTYPYRTTSGFNLRVLPAGCGFSDGGQGVFLSSEADTSQNRLALLGFFYTRLAREFLEISLGEGDAVSSGSAARNYVTGAIEAVPVFSKDLDTAPIASIVAEAVRRQRLEFVTDETAREFLAPVWSAHDSFQDDVRRLRKERIQSWLQSLHGMMQIEEAVKHEFDLGPEDLAFLSDEFGPLPSSYTSTMDSEQFSSWLEKSIEALIAQARTEIGPRRYLVKKAYWTDRQFELFLHIFQAMPSVVASLLSNYLNWEELRDTARRVFSWTIGVAFSRWRASAVFESPVTSEDPFSLIPVIAPGMPSDTAVVYRDNDRIYVDDEGHSCDLITNIRKTVENIWSETGWDQIVQLTHWGRDVSASVAHSKFL